MLAITVAPSTRAGAVRNALPIRLLLAPIVVVDRLAAAVTVVLIGIYRTFISPLLTPGCRFTPSCSQYTRMALLKHGFVRGGTLGAIRIGRCHPFNSGGVDEVPSHLGNECCS